VTRGVDMAHAVARMWLLERTAELNLRACAAGRSVGISSAEKNWWGQSSGLLPRIYTYVAGTQGRNR